MKLVRVLIQADMFYGKKFQEDSEEESAEWVAHKREAKRLEAAYPEFVTYMKEKEGDTYPTLLRTTEMLLNPEQYMDLFVTGAPLTKPTYLKTKASDDGDPFAAVMDKMDQILGMTSVGGDVNYNSKCEVHMPGQALSSYNDTQLMEDACTDELDAELCKGWRIIAACPQPDQRRPDYILGRWNPDRD